MELGEKIRRRRLELGMSQADLADALGYTNRATVAKVESGVNDLTQSKIERYAEALRTTPAYLMDWTDDPYDYDLDPDGRFDSISKPLLEELMDQYHNDAEAVWHAYENMQTASLMDASKEYKAPIHEGDSKIENPDIRMIARAGQKMTTDKAKNLRKYAEFMFPEAFKDDNT